ncbi:MAG TPA: signal peptidase I [Methanosarcinales archaeon]|nr:signal peptidase I [Methanosarcinales archaeon]
MGCLNIMSKKNRKKKNYNPNYGKENATYELKKLIKKFNESDNFWIGLVHDIIFVAFVVGAFMLVSYIIFGTYTPMVAVESGSMEPHLQIGDIVFIQSTDRTDIITYEDGKKINYKSFKDYGDVILYKKYGSNAYTPIIHRAMYYVEKGEQMWKNGPIAPHSGYITKGDNKITNQYYDQQGGVFPEPVKKEWVIGIARARIPLVGYVRLLIPLDILHITREVKV